MGQVVADAAEFATLKNDVKHIEQKVDNIESDVSEISKNNASISESLARLTVVAEQNQKLEPKVYALEKLIWKGIGAMSVLAFLSPFIAPIILKALSGE